MRDDVLSSCCLVIHWVSRQKITVHALGDSAACGMRSQNAHCQVVCCWMLDRIMSGSDDAANHVLTRHLVRTCQSKEATLHMYRPIVCKRLHFMRNKHADVTSKGNKHTAWGLWRCCGARQPPWEEPKNYKEFLPTSVASHYWAKLQQHINPATFYT